MEKLKILYSPIVSNFEQINYEFEGEKITATYIKIIPATEETEAREEILNDTFDFSSFSDGEAEIELIETTLPFVPFNKVEKENGVLKVELINFITDNASENERFTDWIEV